MQINQLRDPTITEDIIVIADIHINSSLSGEFERNRLDTLSKAIMDYSKHSTIIIAGDTFDRNTPSLIDISLFYKFIQDIKFIYTRHIYILNGNHDATTFDYLPAQAFISISEPTIINDLLVLVPWTHIKQFTETTGNHNNKILISHARCTIPPFITEEVSIEKISNAFNLVVLGDIHSQPSLPYSNVIYCTSPSNVTFTNTKKDAHGMLTLNTKECISTHLPLQLPTKRLVVAKSFDEAHKVIVEHSKKSLRDYLKVRYKGTAEELRELSSLRSRYVIKDFSIDTSTIDNVIADKSTSALKDFINAKISITGFAFDFFSNTLNIKEDVVNDIRNKYNKLKITKGTHS